jgi:hypothetical protein
MYLHTLYSHSFRGKTGLKGGLDKFPGLRTIRPNQDINVMLILCQAEYRFIVILSCEKHHKLCHSAKKGEDRQRGRKASDLFLLSSNTLTNQQIGKERNMDRIAD